MITKETALVKIFQFNKSPSRYFNLDIKYLGSVLDVCISTGKET